MLGSLVRRKARRVSCNLKQHAAGFPEVDGMKIPTVDDWSDVVFKFCQRTAPVYLFLIGWRSPCHVMDGSHGNPSRKSFRSADQIDEGTGCAFRNRITEPVLLFGNLLESERLSQQQRRALVAVLGEGYMVEATNCMFGRHGAALPDVIGFRIRGTDEFQLKSVRISEEQHFFAEIRDGFLEF